MEAVLEHTWEWEARCMLAAGSAQGYLALMEAPLHDVAIATIRKQISGV